MKPFTKGVLFENRDGAGFGMLPRWMPRPPDRPIARTTKPLIFWENHSVWFLARWRPILGRCFVHRTWTHWQPSLLSSTRHFVSVSWNAQHRSLSIWNLSDILPKFYIISVLLFSLAKHILIVGQRTMTLHFHRRQPRPSIQTRK